MLYHSITTMGTKYYGINFRANHPPKCRPSVETSRDSFLLMFTIFSNTSYFHSTSLLSPPLSLFLVLIYSNVL